MSLKMFYMITLSKKHTYLNKWVHCIPVFVGGGADFGAPWFDVRQVGAVGCRTVSAFYLLKHPLRVKHVRHIGVGDVVQGAVGVLQGGGVVSFYHIIKDENETKRTSLF